MTSYYDTFHLRDDRCACDDIDEHFRDVSSRPALKNTFLFALHDRSACDDIDAYFGDVSSVGEIDRGSVITVECPPNADGEMIEEIVIGSGKTLTIKSTQPYVR